MNIDNYNEDLAAENILDELRKKEVVRPEFLHDLGDIGGKPTVSKPKKDPSVKMQIRQAQVCVVSYMVRFTSSVVLECAEAKFQCVQFVFIF